MADLKLYETYDKTKTKALEGKLLASSYQPSFTENGVSVLKKRYFMKNEEGLALEDEKGLLARVAANVAYPDLHYSNQEAFERTGMEFYEMLIQREFMPNSPTLMNAGRKMQQLAACFVLPIDDSMGGENGILTQITNAGLIHQSGGGTGFAFSRIRRKNHFVSTTYGKASGPVSFIGAYAAITHSINQGGFRRGANMGCMIIDHPDSLEFILAKTKEGTIPSFNFSVLLTDIFMDAMENNGYFTLYNPFKGGKQPFITKDVMNDMKSMNEGLLKENELNYIMSDNKEITETNSGLKCKVNEKGEVQLNAREVFDVILKAAWRNGEPGVLFIDTINKYNPTPGLGEIESTNPCGEQPLLPYEACNLGSINLKLMVKDKKVDYERLREITRRSVHFLDNVIDMSSYPIPQIDEMVRKNRKIGLGVMGWANMLVKLGIPYDSDEALGLAEDVMGCIQQESKMESERMAEQRGSFLAIDKSIYKDKGKMRNATTTTIAPTGTIGIIAGAYGGIEPFFGLTYSHKDADGQKRKFIVDELEEILREKGIEDKTLLERIEKNNGSLKGVDGVPDKIKRVFLTSKDVSPEWHVKMQAAFQKYVDNAVSKTINMPFSATVEDVKKAYSSAYKLGCKGLTVYRDGSREEQVLEAGTKAEGFIEMRSLPSILDEKRYRQKIACGDLFVHVAYDKKDNTPVEAFGNLGKSGGCLQAQIEAIGRLVSMALRAHIDPKTIVKQLRGIQCNRPYGISEDTRVLSCPDAIGIALGNFLAGNSDGDRKEIELIVKQEISPLREGKRGSKCKNCGKGILEFAEGCREGRCPECDWSPCG